MSKQSNQKYRRELEKKAQTTNSIESSESTNSAKQENLYISDKVKEISDCSNNTNTNQKQQ